MKRAVLFCLFAGCQTPYDTTAPDDLDPATDDQSRTNESPTYLVDTGSIGCTGTKADLEASLEIRDLNGNICTSCVGNAEFTLVISNPCPNDVVIDIACDPGAGFVEGWEAVNAAGASRSLSHGCGANPLQVVVPGNGEVRESFLWNAPLQPGVYDYGKAYLYLPNRLFKIKSGAFEVL